MSIQVSKIESKMIDRMKDKNDYIVVGVGNLWWANQNHKGALIEAMTDEEKDALWSLERKGLVKKETRSYQL